MNASAIIRTPLHQQPITLVYKAIRQKVYRNLHCFECGMPIAQITDKVVMAFDGESDTMRLEPDKLGIVDIRCDRHTCKQYYRLEFAV